MFEKVNGTAALIKVAVVQRLAIYLRNTRCIAPSDQT